MSNARPAQTTESTRNGASLPRAPSAPPPGPASACCAERDRNPTQVAAAASARAADAGDHPRRRVSATGTRTKTSAVTARGTWADYLQRLEDRRRGHGLPEGWVPGTFRVAVVADEIVGRISLRHVLDERLAQLGGHVGYAVVPSARRQGFATEMLRQGLVIARSEGVDRVLVTCDEDNEGSATPCKLTGVEVSGAGTATTLRELGDVRPSPAAGRRPPARASG